MADRSQQVKEIIAAVWEESLPEAAGSWQDIGEDTPLYSLEEGEASLGLDSLDAVELVLLLKKHYQVEIKDMDEAREPFASIAALANHIRAQRTAP